MNTEMQRFFEQAVKGLLYQGERSLLEDTKGPAYHGHDGNRCGIGMCMADEAYNEGVENSAVEDPHGRALVLEVLSKSGWDVSKIEIDFLVDIQVMHDETNPEDWTSDAMCIGERYSLNTDFIKE